MNKDIIYIQADVYDNCGFVDWEGFYLQANDFVSIKQKIKNKFEDEYDIYLFPNEISLENNFLEINIYKDILENTENIHINSIEDIFKFINQI